MFNLETMKKALASMRQQLDIIEENLNNRENVEKVFAGVAQDGTKPAEAEKCAAATRVLVEGTYEKLRDLQTEVGTITKIAAFSAADARKKPIEAMERAVLSQPKIIK